MQIPEGNYNNTFLQIDGESGVQFFGLPEEVTKIEQNKEKLHKAKGGDTFDSTKFLKCGMREPNKRSKARGNYTSNNCVKPYNHQMMKVGLKIR